MANGVVYAHIGSSKTGTTFIQQVLASNQQRLLADNVLIPGKSRRVRGKAARGLNHWAAGGPTPGAWLAMAKEIEQHRHQTAIISQEFLCWLDDSQIEQFLTPLGDRTVHVILTTRDLARLIPAQWQSSMRQANSWTLTEYSHAVADLSGRGDKDPARKHFWRRHDYGTILRRWVAAVGSANVTVVTLPPSGAEPDELWRRFCTATRLIPERYETRGVRNTSLGASSAEILRRLNATKTIRSMSGKHYVTEVNTRLTRLVMDPRRPQEPSLTLPTEQRDWVSGRAEEIIAEIEETGVRIIGSLDDLRPLPISKPYQAPETISDDDLLAASMDALAGYAASYADRLDEVEGRHELNAAFHLRAWAAIDSVLRSSWRRNSNVAS